MTKEERTLLFETAAALGAILEVLGDGEGLLSIKGVRQGFRERAGDLLVDLHKTLVRPPTAAEKP